MIHSPLVRPCCACPLPLPLKSHSQEAPRKRKTLETKRAVVLERPEKAAAALLQQLNAIRNAKAEKRRAASNRCGGGGWLASTHTGWAADGQRPEAGWGVLVRVQRAVQHICVDQAASWVVRLTLLASISHAHMSLC